MLNFLSKLSMQSVAWVNPQTRVDKTYKDIHFPPLLENQIMDVAQQCARRGYSLDTQSELSIRLSAEKIAIHNQNATFRNLRKQDFQIIPLQSALHASPISACRHIRWHALVYQNTPAKYTLFCHPVHAMIFTNQGLLPQLSAYPDLLKESQNVTITTPDESSLLTAINKFQTILIQGYGLLVWAVELNEIFAKVELLEFSSKIGMIGDQQGERECQN